MKIKILFIFGCAFNLYGETLPLPSSILSTDDIVQEFRGILSNKINDLGKNYITTFSPASVKFTSSSNVNCNGNTIQAGDSVAEIIYSFKKNTARLDEKITYKGCNGDISLIEEITTEGLDLLPISINDIVKVKRTLELGHNEKSRLYRLSNADGDELFKVSIKKFENKQNEVYFFLSQNFLNLNYEFNSNFTMLATTFVGFSANYSRKYSSWKLRNEFIPYTFLVKNELKENTQEIFYFDNNRQRISMTSYVNEFHSYVLDTVASTLSDIIDYHMAYFPKTTTVKTGAQSQRMLEELRIAFNRLLTNTELILVKNLIQEYLTQVESGNIIDNRPRVKN